MICSSHRRSSTGHVHLSARSHGACVSTPRIFRKIASEPRRRHPRGPLEQDVFTERLVLFLWTVASWQHCIDCNTTCTGLSKLGATPAAQVSGGKFPPASNKENKNRRKHRSSQLSVSQLWQPTLRSDDLDSHLHHHCLPRTVLSHNTAAMRVQMDSAGAEEEAPAPALHAPALHAPAQTLYRKELRKLPQHGSVPAPLERCGSLWAPMHSTTHPKAQYRLNRGIFVAVLKLCTP